MNPAQKARTIGFNASLSQRGVLLTVLPDGPEIRALIQEMGVDTEQFSISQETRDMAIVTALRSDLGDLGVDPQVGSAFLDAEKSLTYRVTELDPQSQDIAAKFRCEVSRQLPPRQEEPE